MKTIYSLLFTFACLTSFSQAPQSVSYQGIARDASGNAYASQSISLRLSILQGGVSGTNVYQEIHNTTTNTHGLFVLQMGNGTVQSGSFSNIDWGNSTYFVQTEMDETGGSNYQLLGTSQILSVPYALYAENAGNLQDNDSTNELNTTMVVNGTNLELTDGGGTLTADLSGLGGNTLDEAYDQGGAGAGANITADAGPVTMNTNSSNAIVLDVDHNNTGVGVSVASNNTGNTFSAVQATTNSNSNLASAVIGNTDGAAYGVSGQASATSTAEAAVYGSNLRTTGGHGVHGIGFNGTVGETDYSQGIAVYGENFDAVAPLGNGVGVGGRGYYGVVGEDRYAGGVAGAYGVLAIGDLGATGVKTFIIDHPQDPQNKSLRHFSTESNEVLNVYRGTVELDSNGEAIVYLPDYFDAININPSYNLTGIGGPAQVYIKEKIADNKFVIAGGTAGMEVCWTVYAERNDSYLQQNPQKKEVVVEKRTTEAILPAKENTAQQKQIKLIEE